MASSYMVSRNMQPNFLDLSCVEELSHLVQNIRVPPICSGAIILEKLKASGKAEDEQSHEVFGISINVSIFLNCRTLIDSDICSR